MLRLWSLHWFWAILGFAVVILSISVVFGPWITARIRQAAGWTTAVPPPQLVIRSAPSVEQIQHLSEFVTLRVAVVDILQVEQDGWISGYKGAWFISGDALWTTDLQRARVREIPGQSGKSFVRIELPPPVVSWARLDHTRTRTYDLRSKSWIPLMRVPEQVRDEAYERAQEIVARTAARDEYRRQAQRQTEAVLTRFFTDAGFAAEIVWIEPESR